MPLDLSTIIDEIHDMAGTLDPAEAARRFADLNRAWAELDSDDVNGRYKTAKTSFLLAETAGEYRATAPLPIIPFNYSVAASDGSFILPDRYSPARFYVLNTSTVSLTYGLKPNAEIGAQTEICYKEADLVVPDDPFRTRIDGAILGFRRAIEELRAASQCIEHQPRPALALQDGTLILWQLQPQPDPVRKWVLTQFLDVMDDFRRRDQPVASYISAPGATELMNMLRVSVCDYPINGHAIDCDHCRRRAGHTPACDVLPNITDRYMLSQIAKLQPGDRTAVYRSRSKIMDEYDRDETSDLRICYFYVNVGLEVARVEIPQWVAADLSHLDLVHGIIYDQCSAGRGYPVALQEAHEAAVLSMADRGLVERAVEAALSDVGIVSTHTGKDGSKRGRFV